MKTKLNSTGAIFTLVLLLGGWAQVKAQNNTAAQNKRLIKKAFDNWVSRKGTPFDLLAENVEWTIMGSSPQAKTYHSKKQLMDEVLDPLNERLQTKIVPKVRGIFADGDMVIVLWDGNAEAINGTAYDAGYAWFMQMHGGKVSRVTAFLDNQKFAEVMQLPEKD